MKRAAILGVLVVVGACDHTAPYGVEDPEPVGPISSTPPTQLTFSTGEDVHPSASSDAIVFSRLEPGRSDNDRCIAVLPSSGGTLLLVRCAGGSYEDGMVDAWIEPALSPDSRLAYVRDRGLSYRFGPTTRSLVVTPLEDPDSITFELEVPFWLEDGRRITGIRHVSWIGSETVRFLAGDESYYPGSDVFPDTLFTPFRVVDLTVATGGLREHVATEGAYSYTAAPDGGIWFVLQDTPDQLYHVPPEGDTTVLGSFSAPVISVTAGNARPVASVLKTFVDPQTGAVSSWTEIEWLDLTTGAPGGSQRTSGLAGRISGVPGSPRVVAEILGANETNLWLLAIP